MASSTLAASSLAIHVTDAEFEAQRARVTACFEHWLYRMSMLTQWMIHFTWHRDSVRIERSGEKGGCALFEVFAEWERLRAQIDVYLPEALQVNDEDLSKAVIEELLHVLVNEQREWSRFDDGGQPACMMHEERVVAQLTVAFWQSMHYDPTIKRDYPWPI